MDDRVEKLESTYARARKLAVTRSKAAEQAAENAAAELRNVGKLEARLAEAKATLRELAAQRDEARASFELAERLRSSSAQLIQQEEARVSIE